jgi:xanthine dehydrogenase YagT iron-sulfur-binding subunit
MSAKPPASPPALPEVSRRTFITTVGAGVVGAAALAPGTARAATPRLAAGEVTTIALRLNGRVHHVEVTANTTLLEVLRDQLGFTGTKLGCARGECGACTVLMGDLARYACMTLALEAEGADITTVEGLMHGEALGPVQQAFVEDDGFQCGFCTPGQVMAVEALLRRTPDPSPDQIREGVSGNLCRCGAYEHIFTAARRAAVLRRGQGR